MDVVRCSFPCGSVGSSGQLMITELLAGDPQKDKDDKDDPDIANREAPAQVKTI